LDGFEVLIGLAFIFFYLFGGIAKQAAKKQRATGQLTGEGGQPLHRADDERHEGIKELIQVLGGDDRRLELVKAGMPEFSDEDQSLELIEPEIRSVESADRKPPANRPSRPPPQESIHQDAYSMVAGQKQDFRRFRRAIIWREILGPPKSLE